MNNDLISRSELKKAFEEDMKCGGVKINEFDKGYDLGIKTAIEMLDNAPTADDWENYSTKLWKEAYEQGKADRPKGEWVNVSKSMKYRFAPDYYKCSNCDFSFVTQLPFCPSCGADMRKGGEGDDE